MGEPSTFLTLETLQTLAGQVLAVGMLTQAVKSGLPWLSTYGVRLICVVTGIALQLVLIWQAGMPVAAYGLALINGTMVALSAMKVAELIKGGPGPQPPQ